MTIQVWFAPKADAPGNIELVADVSIAAETSAKFTTILDQIVKNSFTEAQKLYGSNGEGLEVTGDELSGRKVLRVFIKKYGDEDGVMGVDGEMRRDGLTIVQVYKVFLASLRTVAHVVQLRNDQEIPRGGLRFLEQLQQNYSQVYPEKADRDQALPELETLEQVMQEILLNFSPNSTSSGNQNKPSRGFFETIWKGFSQICNSIWKRLTSCF